MRWYSINHLLGDGSGQHAPKKLSTASARILPASACKGRTSMAMTLAPSLPRSLASRLRTGLAPTSQGVGSGRVIVAVVLALKFILPVLILRYPFGAGWANFVLDSVDGDILIRAGLHEPTYQVVDKIADWWTYLIIFIWGWKTPIRRPVAFLFAFRTVGQVLFLVTRNELALFFFPNLLEPLFLIYVTIGRFKGVDRSFEIYHRHRVVIWAFILIYKFQDEYVTHVANVDRSETIKSLFGG